MAFITHSNRPPTASATSSNRLSNRLWGHLCGPFPSTASLPTHTQDAQDASHFHTVIEAMRAVQYKMSRTLGDPPAAAQSDAWAQWMTDRVAASAASRTASAMTPRCARDTAAPPTDCGPDAAPSPAPKAIATDEDTVGVALVDPRGMAVALIQSNCLSFGAGLVAPGLGFPLQARGSAFNTVEGHPNAYGPAKRPFHSLMPVMAHWEGAGWSALATTGGVRQSTTTLQVLLSAGHAGEGDAWGRRLHRKLGCSPRYTQMVPKWRLAGQCAGTDFFSTRARRDAQQCFRFRREVSVDWVDSAGNYSLHQREGTHGLVGH